MNVLYETIDDLPSPLRESTIEELEAFCREHLAEGYQLLMELTGDENTWSTS